MTAAEKVKELRGVGGWLAFFTFGCFLSPLVMVGQTVAAWSGLAGASWINLVSMAPLFAFAKGYEISGEIALGASMLALGVLILRKHPAAGQAALIVLTILPVFYLSDMAITAASVSQLHVTLHQMGRPILRSDTSAEDVQMLRAVIASLLWLLYFLKSKRVRNTFGPVTWRRAAELLGAKPA
jgi:hypothetical protein